MSATLPERDPWTNRCPQLFVYHPAWEIYSSALAEICEVGFEQIAWDASVADDLGADSLDLVELAEALEEGTDIKFDDQEVNDVVTVGDGYELYRSKFANIDDL